MDRTQGLNAFVRSVEAGSFSGGARILGTTPSAISRSIARLERRLEVRLFQRSTRSLTLTDEGQAYFDRVAPLMRDLETAEEALRSGVSVEGTLRVTMPTVLGNALMDEIVEGFLPHHPDLKLQASITDRHVDVIAERFDVALRAGSLPDSGLTVRAIGLIQLRLVASSSYLEIFGRPDRPEGLMHHSHIRYLQDNRPYPLLFADGTTMLPSGRMDVDDGTVMLRSALGGAGIAQLLHPIVAPHLAGGALEEVLPQFPMAQIPLQFVHAYARRPPARVRAFMDFVSERLLPVMQ